jgi:hypothetical protein
VPLGKTQQHHKSPSPPQQPEPQTQPKPTALKTAQERCEEVLNDLTKLEKEVGEFNGKKTDKQYLKLEEYLTRCLLKLDEIDRTDDKINQIRRKLINYTHLLSDKLDAIATMYEKNLNDCNHKTNSSNNNDKNETSADNNSSNDNYSNKMDSNSTKSEAINSSSASDNQNINENMQQS